MNLRCWGRTYDCNRAASEKIVGGFGLWQFAKCVIAGEFEDTEGTESV
jgi:hypothetical protein